MITKIKHIEIIEYRTPEGEYHNPHGPAWKMDDRYTYMLNGDEHNIVGPITQSNLYYINGNIL